MFALPFAETEISMNRQVSTWGGALRLYLETCAMTRFISSKWIRRNWVAVIKIGSNIKENRRKTLGNLLNNTKEAIVA